MYPLLLRIQFLALPLSLSVWPSDIGYCAEYVSVYALTQSCIVYMLNLQELHYVYNLHSWKVTMKLPYVHFNGHLLREAGIIRSRDTTPGIITAGSECVLPAIIVE
ncbi:hypothetical protein BGW36DRAFT_159286 [Talaromyces proteolyticus]|uniref:Secreted protein n=1 Tax=Talaromyces proteolyticus TaxID=1131652 RepID=A0AAD4KQB0_9EURO|nr:uncharacterized protein BGW36DRAFT_159286 [Talaromyces proteolyticus]KAH8697010.1 hypothetical protein BGW36DRAFT_159286 [Talaromyces proteolyticus]